MSYPHASDIGFNETQLRVAAIFKRTVKFSYQKDGSSAIESRRFQPKDVEEKPNGTKYFKGFDPDRNQPRNYRLDRVLGDVEILAT